jgi:uncharacterized membrane protein
MKTAASEQLSQSQRGKGYRSRVNQIHFGEASFGERLADRIAAGVGSWSFLIVQTIAVIVWVGVNLAGFIERWDPYPFILLNLMFSVQAAYTGPVLLLASNRQTQKDRLTLEHAAGETEKTETENRQLLEELKRNTELTVRVLQRIEQPPPSASNVSSDHGSRGGASA